MLPSGAVYWPNRFLKRDAPYGARQQAILSHAANARAWAGIRAWPGYAETPLVELPQLARAANVARLLYKDENRRFALRSFKALGGAYAVQRLLSERLAEAGVTDDGADALMSGRHRELTQGITVAAATDGNHGRSVAWGAQMFHCACIIYLHENVSRAREEEIARYGATVRRVPGGYDQSVHQCADDARREGWKLVADTSANGDAYAPSLVMQGYTLLAEEVRQQTASAAVTHVFTPAAVGGLAAAVVGHYWETEGAARPLITAVQPRQADAIARSVTAGALTPASGDGETFMACLAATKSRPPPGTFSTTVSTASSPYPTRRRKRRCACSRAGQNGDRPLVSGESGCAATAGFLAAAADPSVAGALGLTSTSVVVVIGSEGATDERIYTQTVGETPDAVQARSTS